jgi:proteasome alpha subunit
VVSSNFYVDPEQLMKDRAEYARKGIARGRPLVALAWHHGVVFVSENPSSSLYKTSEIYDQIAFAAVGRYNEFEALRVAGIRLADIKGFQYAREDVSAKPLANAYSQALGASFIGDTKPFEVELVIAQVGAINPDDTPVMVDLFHITYDGSLNDAQSFLVIGGDTEPVRLALEGSYRPGMSRDQAITLAVTALQGPTNRHLEPQHLEVSGLDASLPRRRFFRLRSDELAPLIS